MYSSSVEDHGEEGTAVVPQASARRLLRSGASFSAAATSLPLHPPAVGWVNGMGGRRGARWLLCILRVGYVDTYIHAERMICSEHMSFHLGRYVVSLGHELQLVLAIGSPAVGLLDGCDTSNCQYPARWRRPAVIVLTLGKASLRVDMYLCTVPQRTWLEYLRRSIHRQDIKLGMGKPLLLAWFRPPSDRGQAARCASINVHTNISRDKAHWAVYM